MRRAMLVALLLTAVTVSPAPAQEEQPDGLPSTVAALVQATGALTSAASKPIDNRRTEIRTYRIRQRIAVHLSEGDLDKPPGLPSDFDLLCAPRVKQTVLRASAIYLDAVTAEVKKTAKSEITGDTDLNNIVRAFKTLFADYNIQVDQKNLTDAAIEKQVRENCQRDLDGFAVSYYGVKPITEAGAIAAFSALFELFKSIVAPVIVEGAKFVDEQRRLEKIKKFLKDGNVQNLIKSNAANLRDFLALNEQARAAEAVGHFVEGRAKLAAGLKPVKEVKECAKFAALPADKRRLPSTGAPSDEYVACFAAVWSSSKDAVFEATKAAAEYDQHGDIGARQELAAFDKINASLAKIASGEDDPATFNSVWQAAMRIVSIADKIEKASSKENRDKLTKAVKDFVDAL